MDEQVVAEAVDEVCDLVRADGAVLTLVAADPRTARIEVSLDLSAVICLDCICPRPCCATYRSRPSSDGSPPSSR